MPIDPSLQPRRVRRIPAPLPAVVAALVLALVTGMTLVTAQLEHERAAHQQRAEVVAELSTLRAQLEEEINSTLSLGRGLAAFVATHPEVAQPEFAHLAAELKRHSAHIRNIGLARDNVITHMYPLEGNEAAVGLEYLRHPEQRDAVVRALETGRTVVAGPVKLVQGGEAFISRTPVFVRDGNDGGGSGRYWGLVSIPIDTDSLLFTAGVFTAGETLELALRGKDGLGADGTVFYGDPALFRGDAALATVRLPEGSWQMAARPRSGWAAPGDRSAVVLGVGIVLALIMAALTYAGLRAQRRIAHMALHDPLTGLANRQLFDDRLQQALARLNRSDGAVALLYIDLDSFKPINDDIGHAAGDTVLRETAHRLAHAVRSNDTVARFGGDEFLIVLENIGGADEVTQVAEKLLAALQRPFHPGATEVTCTVSIGGAITTDPHVTVTTLCQRADRAMYRAKEAGKNRFVLDN